MRRLWGPYTELLELHFLIDITVHAPINVASIKILARDKSVELSFPTAFMLSIPKALLLVHLYLSSLQEVFNTSTIKELGNHLPTLKTHLMGVTLGMLQSSQG